VTRRQSETFPGLPSWLVTVASLAVLYPAAMGTWMWTTAMLYGRDVVQQCGPGLSSVDCLGEGWAESGFMIAGLVLGLFGMSVLVYSTALRIGRWISARRPGRPVNSWIPRRCVAVWSAGPVLAIASGAWYAVVGTATDSYGPGSRFETALLGTLIVVVALLGWVGIQRGAGWRWRST
jgi:hypothetical protein